MGVTERARSHSCVVIPSLEPKRLLSIYITSISNKPDAALLSPPPDQEGGT